MRSLLARTVRPGAVILLCAVMAGCAMELAPYQSQSVESSVQIVLSKQGYYQGPIDGSVGPATSRAIRSYQRDHRLTPTGTINPALLISMGLSAPADYAGYYTGYPAYYSGPYVSPAWYAPPAVIGLGWGGGWGGCWPGAGYGWNRGCGGYGYRGYGGYNGRGSCR